jgi:hypothetical protein
MNNDWDLMMRRMQIERANSAVYIAPRAESDEKLLTNGVAGLYDLQKLLPIAELHIPSTKILSNSSRNTMTIVIIIHNLTAFD